MNREETHALFAQGRDAWNAWAEGMLAERRRLEAAGAWAATRDVFGSLKPGNDATKVWMAAASVEFSTSRQPHMFEQPVDFGGWVFPGYAGFTSATFSGDVGFGRATFSGYALFDSATFSGDAGFGQATFEGFTTYADAQFGKAANFTAIKSTRAFTLANAVFAQVPDFIQALGLSNGFFMATATARPATAP